MADRTDFYFRQRVTEAELDLAFELLEKADRNLAADIGVYGIISGAVPTPHSPVPDLSIDLTAPARAYDNLGQRIFYGTAQTIDCAVDFSGIPTDVPSADQERWLGVFLRFDRLLADPRTDGNSQQVFFRRDESFEIRVRQAPVGPAGAAPKVPLQPAELLICDIRRLPGQTQIMASDIDTARRQAFLFAQGDAVSIISSLWTILQPAVNTVQSALDAVDAEIGDHFTGTARRHPAAQIEYTPRGFVAATDLQAAVDEIIDDLSTAATGDPGAARIGADAVPGTPHALPASDVDSQLSQLLAWLNQHVSAAAGAHNASAIGAQPHAYISATSVQAQLQEIVSDLQSQAAGAAGASQVGAEPVTGAPSQLLAGTVTSQLSQLLAAINSHASASADAHAAAAISLSDAADQLTAAHVEDGLAECASMFASEHYRANQANAGKHRAIHQPALGTGRVLLWESAGNGTAQTRLRVYADNDAIWFTLNAAWNGSEWQRDAIIYFAGGFRFTRFDFELMHQTTGTATFTDWTRTWRLPMSSTVNSGFEMTGSVREIGRLGMEGTNTDSASRSMALGGAVTFRSRFPTVPSSITLSATSTSTGWSGVPIVWSPDRDGFGFYDFQNVPAGQTIYWFGTYEAIA